ncbi:MAG: hypothetical protein AWU54_740 [Candidatus Frackibacter sp. T328-2]|nr:MAG: hypothetical protein AWU54_740 [Candidatus Frackibacter sp. T328-2]
MHIEDLKGNEINLRKPKDDFSDLTKTAIGQLTEVKEDEFIIKLKGDLDFKISDAIQVIYIDSSQGVHYFTTEIKSREEEIIKLKLPDIINRRQRRQFVRVEYKTDIQFSPVSYQGENLTHLEEKKGAGQMVDISGGGICMLSDIRLLKGLVVELNFSLKGEEFKILGEVVRIMDREEDYEMGVKFDFKSSKIENQISNFVLKQQIINRRRAKMAKEKGED